MKNTRSLSILFIFFFSLMALSGLRGQSSEAEREVSRERRLARRLAKIDEWTIYTKGVSAPSSGDEIEELVNGYSYLKSAANDTGAHYVDEVVVLRDQLRELLFSHPGHAQHFLDNILASEMQLEEEELSWKSAQWIFARSFESLGQMPTHESVVCLTSLLGDQKGWAFFPGEGGPSFYYKQNPREVVMSLAGRAVEELRELEIVEDPVLERRMNDPDAPAYGEGWIGDYFVPLWRDWWQEVVDGQQTFSFRGDPRRYNHLGEVGPNWKPSRPTLDSTPSATALGKIPSQTPSLQPGAQPAKKAPTPAYWLALILVLLAVVSVVLVRRGQRLP